MKVGRMMVLTAAVCAIVIVPLHAQEPDEVHYYNVSGRSSSDLRASMNAILAQYKEKDRQYDLDTRHGQTQGVRFP